MSEAMQEFRGQQLSLIDGESDEALMLPRDEAQKRFTASTVEKLETKRNGIVALFGCGLPVYFIAETMKCNDRIVKLLGAKYSGLAASSAKEMGKVLGALAMKAAFHIDQKMADAKVGELGVVMGISLQRKQEMELAGGAVEDVNGAIEAETESPALASARKFFEDRDRALRSPTGVTE
jgi:hypothetical protein